VLQREPRELDANGDHCISVMELFAAAVGETEKRFASDRRLPTEHAQLDDNGDGKGTEFKDIQIRDERKFNLPPAPAGAPVIPEQVHDGQAALLTLLPLIIPLKDDASESPSAPESTSNTP
jgi:hypothetical protein